MRVTKSWPPPPPPPIGIHSHLESSRRVSVSLPSEMMFCLCFVLAERCPRLGIMAQEIERDTLEDHVQWIAVFYVKKNQKVFVKLNHAGSCSDGECIIRLSCAWKSLFIYIYFFFFLRKRKKMSWGEAAHLRGRVTLTFSSLLRAKRGTLTLKKVFLYYIKVWYLVVFRDLKRCFTESSPLCLSSETVFSVPLLQMFVMWNSWVSFLCWWRY